MTPQKFSEAIKPLYWSDLNIPDTLFCRRAGITYIIIRANSKLYTLIVTDFTGSITYKFDSLEKEKEKANHIMECQLMQYSKFGNK